MNKKFNRRLRIKKAVRGRIHGTQDRPRLTVFRSNKQIYAQIVNDADGCTMVAASSLKQEQNTPKKERAAKVGQEVAEKAIAAGINQVVFDRNGYLYHGRIRELADAARKAGLKF